MDVYSREEIERRILAAYRSSYQSDTRTDRQLKTAFIDDMVKKAFFSRRLEKQGFSGDEIREILTVAMG